MKLSLSQNLTSTVSAEFDPATHPNIKAFYKFKSLGGADISNVSNWTDQTGNFDMLQATESEQPEYTASDGALFFDGAGSTAQDFDLNSATIQDATNFNLIVSRDDDGLIKIFFNGTEQTDTNTRTGTFLIDAIGVRATDANDLEGSIFEVQIYDDISFTTAGFITKVNNRLASL